MAMKLSQKEWKLGFSVGPGQAPRLRSVPGRDLERLKEEIQLSRERFGLGEDVAVEKYFAGKCTNEKAPAGAGRGTGWRSESVFTIGRSWRPSP